MENTTTIIELNNEALKDQELKEKVELILRQTNYSLEEAREKLHEYNDDHMQVIKSYFGITEKKELPVKSINQEIFRQLRKKLDTNMRDYKVRVEKGEAKQLI
jgi:hypothetical protein